MNHFPHLLLVPSVLNKPHLSVTSLADYSHFIVRIHDQAFKFVSASSASKHTEVSLGNDTKDQTADKKSASTFKPLDQALFKRTGNANQNDIITDRSTVVKIRICNIITICLYASTC